MTMLPPCSAILFIAIANFAMLRRQLGLASLGAVIAALEDRLKTDAAIAAVDRVASDVIQISMTSASTETLKARLVSLERLLTVPASPNAAPWPVELAIGGTIALDRCEEVLLTESAEAALALARLERRIVVTDRLSTTPDDDELDLLRSLGSAASDGQFSIVYQPKVHVRQRAVTSAEALIRWNHPTRGLIMPDAFIPLADRSGDIRGIALWTLDRVIADQKLLAVAGHNLRIFINISGPLLTDVSFIDRAIEIVSASHADIGFEITETSVIHDPDLAIANLERCASNGIVLAIDDYGSGLSSLSYLKRLPASELKIDKMFVTQLTSSHRDPLIVRSTIDLAHALDLEVTAEGVETPAALALLTVMGCEMVQGYLISLPLPFEQFATYLDDYRFEAAETGAQGSFVRPASFWQRG